MKSNTIKGTAVIALSLLVAASSFATKNSEYCEFAPQNNVQVPIGYEKAGQTGLDEKTYNSAIDLVEKYYKPIVAAKGATLKINRMWTTNAANSTAHRTGKMWFVDAYGGLARLPIMTRDAEVAVLCHEMGHHLGGFPQVKSLFGSSWASNEGQADYYATMKCFRLVNAKDDNVTAMSNISIPKAVTAGCQNTFKSTTEIALCQREALAGKVLAQVLWELGGGKPTTPALESPKAPDFETPDASSVSATNSAHPAAQCRLDTYFSGSICGIAASEEFGQKDGITGACAQEKGDKMGFRPTCWYKPGK